MAYSPPTSLEVWQDMFHAPSDQAERKHIVEQVAALFPLEAARGTLMHLLATQNVETRDPNFRGKPDLVFGANNPDPWRISAYRLLVENLCWTGDAFSFARRMVLNGGHHERRHEAIHILRKYFINHPETLGLLMDSADNDSWEYARASALMCIATNFGHHPETYPYLIRAATWFTNSGLASDRGPVSAEDAGAPGAWLRFDYEHADLLYPLLVETDPPIKGNKSLNTHE